MKWNDDIIFKFIQQIQLYPCLWNPGDKNKKNRNKVHDAFKTIAEEMGTENIDELKKKKESLFQTYRGYRRKVFCSQKSGAGICDIYKPTCPPYSFLDNFLHGIYTPKGKVDTLVKKNQSPKRPAKRSSMKRPRKEQNRADVAFNELLAIKEKIVTRNSSCVSRDECTVYGELLAIKLRRLNGRTQRLAMHKIDNIMFDLTFDSSMLPSPRSSSSHSSHIITIPLPSPGSSCAQYSPQSQPVIATPLPSPGSSCAKFNMSGSQKRSDIWKYFTTTSSSDKAKCTLCSTIYFYKGGTTSNLKKHLSSKHPTIILDKSVTRISVLVEQKATNSEEAESYQGEASTSTASTIPQLTSKSESALEPTHQVSKKLKVQSSLGKIFMSKQQWTSELTTHLILLYENYLCLYKVKSKEYHNRETRNQAYQDITSGLRNVKPSIEFTKAMVTAKIHTLRTQYSSERNKIRKSELSGASPDEIYVPKLWCFEMLRFLDDAEVIVEGQSNLDPANTEIEEEGDVLFEGSIDDASKPFTPDFEVNEDTPSSSVPYSNKTPNRTHDSHNETPAYKKRETPVSKKRKLEDNQYSNMLECATSALKNITNKKIELLKQDDTELNDFSQYFAKEMKTIKDEDILDTLKSDIMHLVITAKREYRAKRCE
ncbi:unnamed protein product [Psylliodes chrysocephalus]|uniref:MADF domain-containing protein n=1 Tax=Psylliodes chrysocephalus TaxID=3402493 RepID=A0A9P0GFH2_9CUCU|nr:unnamed protein product [Psylliodes chrysocephala]